METTPNIVILAPILKPLADNVGMNEIQFCTCDFNNNASRYL